MTDQCIHCTVRGKLDECKQTPCSQHESWYALAMIKSLAAAKRVIESKEAIQLIQEEKLKGMNEAIFTLKSEREANAMLTDEIERNRAAIDELLGALQLAVSIIGHPDDAHSTMIRAAIAKHEPKP